MTTMITNVLVLVFLVFLCFKPCYNARILATVPTASYSHQVAFRPIWKELAKRGHEIVLMTTDLMEPMENLRQIDMSFAYDVLKRENYDVLVTKQKENPIEFLTKFLTLFKEIDFEQLKLPEVQKMIHNKSEKFDLLMIEVVFPYHLGLIERFNVPVIGLSSFEIPNKFHKILGNAAHSVLHPDTTIVPYVYPLTLKERIISWFFEVLLDIYVDFIIGPDLDYEMRTIFGENCKSVSNLYAELDMVFLNMNPILHSVRALTPNTIQFGGGTHVEHTTQPLPKKIPSSVTLKEMDI